MKELIHAWELKGIIHTTIEFKLEIRRRVLEKFKSFQNAARNIGNITGVSISFFLRNEKVFMKTHKLYRITDNIGLPREEVERHIDLFKDFTNGPVFHIKFPVRFTPLMLRVISHVTGDGCASSNMLRWTQQDTTPLQKLIKSILGVEVNSNKGQLTIPALIGKVTCAALILDRTDFKLPIFVEKIMELSKPFKLQFLLAIIDDEGTIDWKNYGGIDIRMSDKRLVEQIRNLCLSLGLKVSTLKEIENNGSFSTENSKLFRFKILAEGIRILSNDIQEIINNIGEIGSFWIKKDAFEKRVARLWKVRFPQKVNYNLNEFFASKIL